MSGQDAVAGALLKRTGPGRQTAQPGGLYEPAPRVRPAAGAMVVDFVGRDGRSKTYSFAGLPLPYWHADLAGAFAVRTNGTDGGLSTLAGANGSWGTLQRLMRFLGDLRRPPGDVSALTSSHLERFRLHRSETLQPSPLAGEMREVFRLLARIDDTSRLRPDVIALLTQAQPLPRSESGVPGYDDATREAILRCARADAVRIFQRLHEGEELVRRFRDDPESLSETEREVAGDLAVMATTGWVPGVRIPSQRAPSSLMRAELARRLFLTPADLPPLIVLGVLVSGWNGETVKELPAAHQILEGKAVVIEIVKRRRGPQHWLEPVTLEIGKETKRFSTAGGYYLFLHRLTERSRQFSGSTRVWSVWVGGRRNGKEATNGHVDPFARVLGRQLNIKKWARDQPELAAIDGFELSLNRLKTTEDRRYTRATGGHLPSSARTNTQDVLFNNYLRGDPVVQEWAEEVLGHSLEDAEAAARAEHQRLLAGQGGHLRVLPGTVSAARQSPEAAARLLGTDVDTAQRVLAGEKDAAFVACGNERDSPFNEGACQASFLMCFACRNALSTQAHLPAQLALLDELASLWEVMDRDLWWSRFGQVWLAVNEDILPRFTAAERADAEQRKPTETVLNLLEGPQEHLWD